MDRRGWVLAAVVAALAGCSEWKPEEIPKGLTTGGGKSTTGSVVTPPPVPEPGDTSFVSPSPNGPRAQVTDSEGGTYTAGSSGGTGTAGASGGTTGAGAPGAKGGDGSAREIEESDVYKVVGDTLFVLNAYRGLQVLDVSDLDHPHLLARVPVVGRPVDLYVRDGTAYVVVSDVFRYSHQARAGAAASTEPWLGSQVWAVDVSQPARPQVLSVLPVEGTVSQTRIVGQVLYVVSDYFSWYSYGDTSSRTLTYVASFDLSNPAALAAVQRLDFPTDGYGYDVHANVTQGRIVISRTAWDYDQTGSWNQRTDFTPVDISDPAGALRLGQTFSAPGQVQDRWAMDFDPQRGLFRAVLRSGWGNNGGALRVFSAPTVDAATEVGALTLDVAERVTAASFDGTRAYVVTAYCTDPLFVIDTSDPARPALRGEVHMPGALDFVLPRGDQLLALGHDGPGCSAWSGSGHLALSLFDVADADHPAMTARVAFGQSYSQVNASADDMRKAVQVLDGLGLVLVPFQSWDSSSWQYQGGTQLVDLGPAGLTLRGFAPHAGAIERAFPVRDRLLALSDRTLQVLDATDRDHPATTAEVDLARPVIAVAPVGDKLVELVGDWTLGDTALVVAPAADPDGEPLARVRLAAPYARMFQDGAVSWVLASDPQTGRPWLQAVDFAAPTAPRLRGRLDLDPGQGYSGYGYGGWYGSWGYGDEVALTGHALVMHQSSYCYAGSGCPGDTVRVVDLSDPDAPREAVPVTLPNSSWSWGLLAQGSYAWITHYEWVPGSNYNYVRYFVDRIDLTDPARPALAARINVPGVAFAASDDGRFLFTQELTWPAGGGGAWSAVLHKLELVSGGCRARLLASTPLPGYPEGASVAGGYAYLQSYDWSGSGNAAAQLATVRLDDLAVTDTQAVAASWSWLRKAEGGKLFVQASWYESGLLVYDLADPAAPRYQATARTSGWANDVVVRGDVAYLPSGMYGVPTIDLTPGSVPVMLP